MFRRTFTKIRDFPQKVERFIQRGRRGWADSDTWSMDYYLITVILPMLKYLKDNNHGFPGSLKSSKEWDDILSEMISGFEAGKRVLDDNYLDVIQPDWYDSSKETKELLSGLNIKPSSRIEERKRMKADEKQFHKAMRLMDKWFFNLWD